MSSTAANRRPQKPGNEGKHIEPSTPPAFMSLTRSSMSQQPGRISSKAVGSMPYSSFGRPATALSPMLGMTEPSKTQTSDPSSVCSTCGRPVGVLRRDVAVEQVGWLDQVVVDADEDQVVGAHALNSSSVG